MVKLCDFLIYLLSVDFCHGFGKHLRFAEYSAIAHTNQVNHIIIQQCTPSSAEWNKNSSPFALSLWREITFNRVHAFQLANECDTTSKTYGLYVSLSVCFVVVVVIFFFNSTCNNSLKGSLYLWALELTLTPSPRTVFVLFYVLSRSCSVVCSLILQCLNTHTNARMHRYR